LRRALPRRSALLVLPLLVAQVTHQATELARDLVRVQLTQPHRRAARRVVEALQPDEELESPAPVLRRPRPTLRSVLGVRVQVC